MNTFDLVFFNNSRSSLKRYIVTPKKWDHVGIILVNPTWLHPGLIGTYVWEMSNSSDKTMITPYSERIAGYKGQIYIRRRINKTPMNLPKMQHTNNQLICNTRDTVHSYLQLKKSKPLTDSFWLPGFIAYVLVRMDYLNIYGLQWDTVTVKDFEPSGRIDKYLLPGLEYATKLTKIY
jgi:hypothetical protein